ncbi:MAG: DUF4432 family protein [Planctomycetota bacterium]|jgi:hypothetical protein
MLKLVSIIIVTMGISLASAVEPFCVVLTDVEQNVYIETLHITNRNLTPDCPIPWSVHKYVLHGGKQEAVEVIEVDNGKLRFKVVPTRGMSVQQVLMGDLRLGWDSPVKGLVHPKFINLHTRQGLGWLEGFNEWMVRCGLEFFGPPGTDEFIDNTGNKAKMDLTLHGKIGNTPASIVEVIIERKVPYCGKVDEACLHGPKLELWTQIQTAPGFSCNRTIERKFGRVPKLDPYQNRFFTIDFALYTSKDQVNATANEIAQIRPGRKTKVDKKPLPVK